MLCFDRRQDQQLRQNNHHIPQKLNRMQLAYKVNKIPAMQREALYHQPHAMLSLTAPSMFKFQITAKHVYQQASQAKPTPVLNVLAIMGVARIFD